MSSVPVQTFNAFRIFDREVERRFTIQPRDYGKYTDEQLHERVPCQLRTFMINKKLHFVVKDSCSLLGIAPNNAGRAISSINPCYVRKENVTLEVTSDTEFISKRTSKYTGEVYLITEPGLYALIQKSRTVYAEEFKRWLNEEVLPTIRTTGSYELAPAMKEDLDEINDNLEQEAFGAELMDDDDRRREFESIVKEKDQLIEEKEKVIVEQKREIETKDTSLNGLMVFLKDMRESLNSQITELRSDNQLLRDDNKLIRSDNKLMRDDIQHLSRDNQVIRSKLDIVIRDRVINTEDGGKHSTFSLYRTGVNNIEKKEYPYCIIRCQRERISGNEKRMRQRYPRATLVYSIENPSAESLFQVLKERAKNDHIGLVFDRTSFYIDAAHENMTLDDVVTLIRGIERERTEIQ
jgi:prophage antirepressor-like protein